MSMLFSSVGRNAVYGTSGEQSNIKHTILAANTNIPSEMIKHNVVLMLVFPTPHKLHASNSNKLTNQMQQFHKFIT
jgi:hypothetical protein